MPGRTDTPERRRSARPAAAAVVLLLAGASLLRGAATTQPASRPAPARGNLVLNGDFEQSSPDDRLPPGWTSRHPRNVALINVGSGRGWVVEMTGDPGLMGSYGVDLLSDRIAFTPNTRYRVSGVTRSEAPKLILFVKGYAELKRRVEGRDQVVEEVVYQMKKEIEPTRDWTPFSLEFEVKPVGTFSTFQHEVRHLRVLLWAYWPAGTCWWDDVRFEELGPSPQAGPSPGKAVTHVGAAPRLGPAATQPDPAGRRLEVEAVWIAAVNAWKMERYAQALEQLTPLLAMPERAEDPDVRLLAARLLNKLGRHEEAAAHARWVIDHGGEPWRREWGRVALGEAAWRQGDAPTARSLLQEVLQRGTSENARAAAGALLDQFGRSTPATAPAPGP